MGVAWGCLTQYPATVLNRASDRPSWMPPNDARAHRRLLSVERPIAGERPPLRAERHEGLFFPAARRQPLSTAAREPNANSDRAKLDTERTRVRRPHAESFSGAPYAGSRGSPRLARVANHAPLKVVTEDSPHTTAAKRLSPKKLKSSLVYT